MKVKRQNIAHEQTPIHGIEDIPKAKITVELEGRPDSTTECNMFILLTGVIAEDGLDAMFKSSIAKEIIPTALYAILDSMYKSLGEEADGIMATAIKQFLVERVKEEELNDAKK